MDDMEPTLGPELSKHYQILWKLSSGGYGSVYLARHQGLECEVALELLHPELLEREADALERFRAEARLTAQLTHPNVVIVLDSGVDGGTPFTPEPRYQSWPHRHPAIMARTTYTCSGSSTSCRRAEPCDG